MHPDPSDLIKVMRFDACLKCQDADWLTSSQMLMPSAYLENPSSSVCDVFIHSSMNKERCPISVARVRLLPPNIASRFSYPVFTPGSGVPMAGGV